MEALLYCCCGLDVHKDLIEACILRGEGLEPDAVRESFGTTKPELKRLTVWLSHNDCYSVAMESTGVYWKPIFEALELCSEYLENVWVVNANHMRNLPGRKTDVGDAEWIATLLRHGLLEKSFVPPAAIRDLRECSRLHRTFVQERCRYVNRLEKFLQAHGFKFSSVMKDILSVSGRKLLNILRDTGSLSEISAAPQEHFSSGEKLCRWAGVTPRNDESAGKMKSRKTLHGNPYVKAILCQAAWAAVKVRNSPFHDWFWSHQHKLGQKKAIIAVSRKLLMLIYLLLDTEQLYQPPNQAA